MSSSNGADFEHHWKRLHNKACEVIASPTDDTVNRMLGSLTALLFGLDESLKQKATGALHLIIQLVTSLNNSNNNNNTHDDDGDKKASQDTTDDRILDHDVVPVPVRSESITMAALKAIKSCVIRNPIGRNQCRAAGVFGFIQQTLIQYSQHIVVVEEAMTTLAAMSLSNDLNALQTATQFRTHIDAAVIKYSSVDTSKEKSNTNNNTSSLLQKLTYLNALSTVVEQEQSLLVTKLKEHHKECDHDNDFDNAYDLFWDDVTFAEQVLDPMTSPQKIRQKPKSDSSSTTENQRARGVHDPNVVDDEDELLLTDAIEKCQLYVDQTKLLDSLVWNLHMARATIRIGKLSMTSTITNSPDPNPTPETETTKDAAVDASDSSDVVAHNGLADIEYCIANTEAGASVSLVPNDSCDTRIHHHSAAQLHFLRAKALFALGTTNATAMEEAKTSLAKALVLDPSKRAEWTTELGGAAGIGPSEG